MSYVSRLSRYKFLDLYYKTYNAYSNLSFYATVKLKPIKRVHTSTRVKESYCSAPLMLCIYIKTYMENLSRRTDCQTMLFKCMTRVSSIFHDMSRPRRTKLSRDPHQRGITIDHLLISQCSFARSFITYK